MFRISNVARAQPGFPARLRPDVAFAAMPSAEKRDIVSAQYLTAAGGTLPLSYEQLGPAWTCNLTNYYGSLSGSVATAGEWTMVCVFAATSNPGDAVPFAVQDISTDARTGFSLYSGNIRFFRAGGAGVGWPFASADVSFSLGRWYYAAMSSTTARVFGCVDGLRTASATGVNPGAATYRAQIGGLDLGFAVGTPYFGKLALVAAIPRALPDASVIALAANPWQLLKPSERRIYMHVGGAGGAIDGVAALTFGEGSSSLAGSGAAAGTAALTFDDGASTLTASGELAGAAALTFDDGASSLTASGALAGNIDLTFDDGASALVGAGGLAGSAALVFANAGSLTDLTAGSIAGTAALTFDDGASALVGAGALAGSSAITFTNAGAVTGAGALTGAAALIFTGAGTLTNATSGDITGTAGLVFGEAATLAGAGALAGSAAMQLVASAVISGGAFITADRRFIAPTRSRSFNLTRSRVFRSE